MTSTLASQSLRTVVATLDPGSFLGARYRGNVERLLSVDVDERLAGFRSRPGEHPWIGEHIGKWIDASSRVVADTGDERLRAMLDETASELIATQGPDGYLGTYPEGRRFGLYDGADWDVWVHKYCLIGLLSYHATTGRPEALAASVRAADLLLATFHDPGPRDILRAGTHAGMAATSVLEPIVELYDRTGDERYLDFARGIIRAWDRPGGPRILSELLTSGRVSRVGNGKAYEMMSNLVGLADFARVTGDDDARRAVLAAWDDIVENHLYVTGTASYGEHFHNPGELPDSSSVNMGETCVTVTWLQFTDRLLHMTGEARYAAEIERTFFNHLAGAQAEDGSAWCYYSPLDGRREYGSGVSCCISSGPRGIAELPRAVFSYAPEQRALSVLQCIPATADIEVGGRRVTVRLETTLPYGGAVRVTATDDDGQAVDLGVRLRRPEWGGPGDEWIVGNLAEPFAVDFDTGIRTIRGTGWNAGKVAFAWGPLVLAYRAEATQAVPATLDIADSAPTATLAADASRSEWTVANRFAPGGRRAAVVAPFALLGQDGGPARVWIADRPIAVEVSAFHGGTESLSSGDPTRASIGDHDLTSFAATVDAPAEDEPWFAVVSEVPTRVSRILFAHGRSLVHGGWFDTTRGRPRVEVLQGDRWTAVGELVDYPDADAVWDRGLRPGQQFELALDTPVLARGVRVIGRGSYGEYPRDTRFATCAQLSAFEDRANG